MNLSELTTEHVGFVNGGCLWTNEEYMKILFPNRPTLGLPSSGGDTTSE